MSSIKLGPRLNTIASFVPWGAKLGDIGTDHAYLPVYLVQENKITKAVGVDINRGPYESALDTVKTYGLREKIDIRLGDGLAPLKKGEVDTVVIAGMGGNTILEILAHGKEVLSGVNDLILQPQGAEGKVRKELLAEGWRLKDEFLVEEEKKLYTVIHLTRTGGLTVKDVEDRIQIMEQEIIEKERIEQERIVKEITKENRLKLDNLYSIMTKFVWSLGPLILQRKGKLLESTMIEQIRHYAKIAGEMQKSEKEKVRLKAEEILQEKRVMEVLKTWVQQ